MLGIEGIDRSGTDPSDDHDLGEPVFLQSFDLGDAAAQEHLVWLCDEIEAEAEPLSVASVECFMRELKEWQLARQEAFPVAPAAHFVLRGALQPRAGGDGAQLRARVPEHAAEGLRRLDARGVGDRPGLLGSWAKAGTQKFAIATFYSALVVCSYCLVRLRNVFLPIWRYLNDS